MDKKLFLLAFLVAAVEVKSNPLSSGVWGTHFRLRRDLESYVDGLESGTTDAESSRAKRGADEVTDSPGSESTDSSRNRRAADSKDCSEDLKGSCKADSCPMDDSSMEKCCKCFETCCASDSMSKEGGSTAEPEPSSEPSSVESATDSAKKYMNETVTDIKKKAENAATKVEGWFKNVGQSIKEGVGTAVDKVKTTANTVKESAKNGINKAADWVKNKTSSTDGNKGGSSCMDGKSAKGALTTTPTNFNGTIDAVNCTVEEISTKASEITGMTDDSSESTTGGSSRRRRNSEESSSEVTTANSSDVTTSTKVPGMKKSKRSPEGEDETITGESSTTPMSSSGGRYRRDADETSTLADEGSSSDGATEGAAEDTEATTEESNNKKSPTNHNVSGNKEHKQETTPIRAPGSVDPLEATIISKNSTSKVSYGISVVDGQQGTNKGNNLEIAVINKDFIKPGRCRPLNQGLKCITLSRDATQCTYDSMCPDNKKCCFYACKPNADVGICEHPVFSN